MAGLYAWRCLGAGSLCLRNGFDGNPWHLAGHVWSCTCAISVGIRWRAYCHDLLAARMMDEHCLLLSLADSASFINCQSPTIN